jgi:hypothetical protein
MSDGRRPGRARRTLAELLDLRGWEVTATGCWEFKGHRTPLGYGRVNNVYTHRIAYEREFGPIPEGLVVCHRCDNPPCCRPDHLFAGTVAENNADAGTKGRKGGEASGMAVLTTADVLEIRRRSATGESRASVARAFGVSSPTVTRIVQRKTWTRV